ncbi:MAG: hypothetical protein ABI723_06020 [Bacteroidia bacterium]
MGNLPLSFLPPKNWQDFEQLTTDMARLRLHGDFEKYGRQGQSQHGVDIYGCDNNYKNAGLQCKLKSNSKTITHKIIDDAIELADYFTPKLDRFIIATTSLRDVKLQEHINLINYKRKNKSLPKIELWTWELFEEEINKHSELSYFYYENILKQFDQYNKDKHILSLLKNSLTRPAFSTPFTSENSCDDFINAVTDTQRAFNTGKLYDRDRNLLASAYAGKNLSGQEDRDEIKKIETILQKIRDFTTDNLKNGNIEQKANFLHFKNNWEQKISETLNSDRKQIIEAMNNILTRNNIEEINSYFTKH